MVGVVLNCGSQSGRWAKGLRNYDLNEEKLYTDNTWVIEMISNRKNAYHKPSQKICRSKILVETPMSRMFLGKPFLLKTDGLPTIHLDDDVNLVMENNYF